METYRVTRTSDAHTVNVDVEQKSKDTGVFRAAIAAHKQLTGREPETMLAVGSGIELDGMLYLRPILVDIS